MKSNLATLELSLDPNEVDALRRDILRVQQSDAGFIPYNSRLAELLYILTCFVRAQ